MISHYLFASLIMQDAMRRYPGPRWLISFFLGLKDPPHPDSGPRHSPEAIRSLLACPLQRSLSLSRSAVGQNPRFDSPQRKLWSMYIHSCACSAENDFASEKYQGVFLVLSTRCTVVITVFYLQRELVRESEIANWSIEIGLSRTEGARSYVPYAQCAGNGLDVLDRGIRAEVVRPRGG